jgi:putative phosphoesterase
LRLAAISDMHSNAVAFEAVIDDLRRQRPDAIVCLGDIVMRGPQPKECLEMLRSLNPLVSIRGNYEHRFTRFPKPGYQPQSYKEEIGLRAFEYDCSRLSEADQQWLANLPLEHTLEIEGRRIDLFHASPWFIAEVTWPWASLEDLSKLCIDQSADLVLFGHVHHSFMRQARGRLVVNSGSVGLPFDGDNRASYAIIDIDKNDIAAQIRRVSYDAEAAIRVAREQSMPDVDVFAHGLRHAIYPYSEPIAAK